MKDNMMDIFKAKHFKTKHVVINCRNPNCSKEIHAANFHPDLDFERTVKTIYCCSRKCLEIWLESVGYIMNKTPDILS